MHCASDLCCLGFGCCGSRKDFALRRKKSGCNSGSADRMGSRCSGLVRKGCFACSVGRTHWSMSHRRRADRKGCEVLELAVGVHNLYLLLLPLSLIRRLIHMNTGGCSHMRQHPPLRLRLRRLQRRCQLRILLRVRCLPVGSHHSRISAACQSCSDVPSPRPRLAAPGLSPRLL